MATIGDTCDALTTQYKQFLESHDLRLVVYNISEKCGEEPASSSKALSSLSFAKRQKLFVKDQMLRSRHFYITPFNQNIGINRHSPYVLQKPPKDFDADLAAIQNSFSETDFSGMWVSVHTAPYLVDGSERVRNTLVCWALVELWTNNERSLRALWIHPLLSAASTCLLLRGFLPCMIAQALKIPAETTVTAPPQPFFSVWDYTIGMLPRCCLPILLAANYIGLPIHFDAIGENGHTDDGSPAGSGCSCMASSKVKKNASQMLFGASASFFTSRYELLDSMITIAKSDELAEEIERLPYSDFDNQKSVCEQSPSDVIKAEWVHLDLYTIQELLSKCWGRNGSKYLKMNAKETTATL